MGAEGTPCALVIKNLYGGSALVFSFSLTPMYGDVGYFLLLTTMCGDIVHVLNRVMETHRNNLTAGFFFLKILFIYS